MDTKSIVLVVKDILEQDVKAVRRDSMENQKRKVSTIFQQTTMILTKDYPHFRYCYIYTGDYCKSCECSGNINTDEPESCDSVTGECLRCLNNTYGTACNLCAPGFYGDAIKLKDCQCKICMPLLLTKQIYLTAEVFIFPIKLAFAMNWERSTVTHTLELVIATIMSLAISVIVAKKITMASILVWAASHVTAPFHQTVLNVMITRAIVDVSRV